MTLDRTLSDNGVQEAFCRCPVRRLLLSAFADMSAVQERPDTLDSLAVSQLDKGESGPDPTSDQVLNNLGYQAEFRREMSLFGVLGISFCAIGILTGMSSAFQTGLFSGGPLGLFWGWNICSAFMLLIALSLAEICSAYPTMGGLYFWVCKMKPDVPVLGFCVNGVDIQHRYGVHRNIGVALYLASLAEVGQNRPLTRLEVAVIAWGVNILSGVINTVGTKAIGAMSSFNLWWTLGGTLVLVVTLLVKAPEKNSAEFVFTDFEKYARLQAPVLAANKVCESIGVPEIDQH
ncbi:hypothetical protein NM688_g5918 [Phlebia brevispora]|uniref:Uncharacterized protein n=1 Tax=Phlebia brevispora TaxID=194682 RepID=A0ACC1SMP3_9APHY|nr:hypothetical protein NM688_g5918 [Phlebia brevispora]